MDTLIFSQIAIFRLQQLASRYYHFTGYRHKLAHENGILDLLRDSVLTKDQNVKASYNAFVAELNHRQVNMLESRGIKLRQPLAIALAASNRKAG